MGEPLKRTFHGCLTCRRRKVRCKGGSPCQNCVRMNITCHSSFETNLRVSVSTLAGRRVTETTSSSAPRSSRSEPPPPPPPTASSSRQNPTRLAPPPPPPPLPPPPPTLGSGNLENRQAHESLPFGFQNQFPTYPLAYPTDPIVASSAASSSASTAAVAAAAAAAAAAALQFQQPEPFHFAPRQGGSDIDPFVVPGGWEFDFASHPAGVDANYHNPFAAPAPTPAALGALLPDFGFDTYELDIPTATANGQSNSPSPDKRSPPPPPWQDAASLTTPSSTPVGQGQLQTREWVPRRRRRGKRGADAENASASETKRYSRQDLNQEQDLNPDQNQNQSQNRNQNRNQNQNQNQDQNHSPNPLGRRHTLHKFVAGYIQHCRPDSCFRMAVLAWAARRSCPPERTHPAIEAHYARARDDVEQLMQRVADPTTTTGVGTPAPIATVAETIILTCFFLNRYDVLAQDYGVMNARLGRLAEWLSNHPVDLGLSALACKVLRLLAYSQVRINIFNNNNAGLLLHPTMTPSSSSSSCHHHKMLLDELARRPDCRRIVERSHAYLSETYGETYPLADLAQDIDTTPPSVLLHDSFCLLSKVLRFSRWKSQSQSRGRMHPVRVRDFLDDARRDIEADFRRIEAEFDLAMATDPDAAMFRPPLPNQNPSLSSQTAANADTNSSSTSTTTTTTATNITDPASLLPASELSYVSLHWLTARTAFLTTRVLWSRAVFPELRTDAAAASAVEAILQIGLRLRALLARTPPSTPTAAACVLGAVLWPLPLFVAGIETTNPVYADWVRGFIEQVSAGVKKVEAGCAAASATKGTSSSSPSSGVGGSTQGGAETTPRRGRQDGDGNKGGRAEDSHDNGNGNGDDGADRVARALDRLRLEASDGTVEWVMGCGGTGMNLINARSGARSALALMDQVRERQDALGRRVDVETLFAEIGLGGRMVVV